MQFLNDNMGSIVGLAVLIAVLAVGYFLVPYMKKQGLVSEQGMKNISQLLELAKIILNNTKLKSETKVSAEKIFQVADIAVRYVEQVSQDLSNEEKKKKAIEVTLSTLQRLGFEATVDQKKLIEIGVEAAVNLLPKTHE